jgi:hypothetical protein
MLAGSKASALSIINLYVDLAAFTPLQTRRQASEACYDVIA